MSFTIPPGEIIGTDVQCDDYCPTLYNRSDCSILKNEHFAGLDNWNVGGGSGGIVNTTEPVNVSPNSNLLLVNQNATIPSGRYKVYYYYYRNNLGVGNAADQILFSPSGDSKILIGTNGVSGLVKGEAVINIPLPQTTITLYFYGGIGSDITLYYLKLCKENEHFDPNCDDFCFNVVSGYGDLNNLLSPFFDANIDFNIELQGTGADPSKDMTSPIAFTDLNFIYNPIGANANTGNHWIDLQIENTDIDYGELSAKVRNIFPFTAGILIPFDVGATEASAISDFAYASDKLVSIKGDSAFNGVDYSLKYGITNFDTFIIPMFRIATIGGLIEGYHCLSFKLNKTNGVRVKIFDNVLTLIFESYTTGLEFNKTFYLPADGTYTIKIEVDDFIGQFGENRTDVLTEASLYPLCELTGTIKDCDDVIVQTELPTYVETTEETGVSYGAAAKFCFPTVELFEGKYYFSLIDCANGVHDFNRFQICNDFPCTNALQLTWDHAICFNGVELNQSGCIWLIGDLQDMTISDTRSTYTHSNGVKQIHFNSTNEVYTLQIENLPPYLRKVIVTVMIGNFYINGIEYQKIQDEDFAPQFNAVSESAMRIIIEKVGTNKITKC